MITTLILTLALLQPIQSESKAEVSLSFDPVELPVAKAGRWEGLFEDGALVPEMLPRDLGPLSEQGRAAYARRDFAAAIASAYELLNLEPDFPPTLLELGTIYFRLRRYGDCVVCLERFLAVAPSQVWRTQVLAHSYYSLGQYEKARSHYEQILAVLKTSAEAVRGLALTHYRIGDSDRALALLDRVMELRPDHAEALIWKAQILYEEDRSADAFAVAEHARRLEPFNPRPHYLLWQIHLDLDREEEAEAAHRKWKELDRVAQEVRSLEGQLLFRSGDYGLAIRLANLQEQIGNIKGTRKALAQAVRNRPEEISEVELRKHVLDVLEGLEDEEGAAQAAKDLGRYCSEDPTAWKRLQTYYARIGDAGMQIKAGELFLRLSRDQ